MGRIRILKKDGNAYLKLPSEFAELEEMEVFALRDGYYLLSVPLDGMKTKEQDTKPGAVTESEKVLLKKLLDVKFQNRTPKNLEKLLKEDEKELLDDLVKRNLVNVFKSKKYPDGVYNISDGVYPMLKQASGGGYQAGSSAQNIDGISKKVESRTENTKQEATRSQPSTINLQPGYTIISDQKQAYEFSQQLKKSGRDKDMICLRGFDGRFYAVNKRYFLANNEKIKEALDGKSNANEVAKLSGIEPDGCRSILNILADKGEVIEKRKDVFVLV